MSATGIDFGTTNSVVAVHGPGGTDVVSIDTPPPNWAGLGFDRVLPSVLAFDAAEEATFGWAAKSRPEGKLEAVKRLFATDDSVRIGGKEYSVEMAAALLFARLKAGAEATGAPLDQAVVTVPANSRGIARFRTKLCAGLAGISVSALVNEPTAAAMAHSLSAREDDQNILVFDWGGGTLDVTVLQTVGGVFIERASKGIQRSGGIDLDNLFAAAVAPEISGSAGWGQTEREVFRLAIERAKVVLSERTEAELDLPSGLHLVSRDTLERAIRGKIEETRGPIDRCLSDLGIGPEAIDHVVLVGGSSKIPAVRQFVSEVLGKEPAGGCDPMTAVAEGAAIAAAILAGELDADFFVGTEHALGTISDNAMNVPEFSVLIGRNHMLPAKAEGGYVPAHDGQKSVLVRVIEGDPAAPLDHPDNVILKELEVDVDPDRPREENAFTLLYDYGVDGILHITVTDDQTGDVKLRDDVSFGVSRDKASLVGLAKAVRQTMEGASVSNGAGAPPELIAAPTVDPASAAVLEQLRTKIIPFVDEDEGQRLEAMCRDLEGASGEDAESCRTALEAEARKYAYLF